MAVEDFLSQESVNAYARLADASQPLDRLRGIRELVAALEADAASLTAVRAAIDAGASWDEVAAAAGLSPAATKWRWQGTDAEIEKRLEAGRKRSTRPSSKPTDLPGHSVAEAAEKLGVSVQAVYLRITRGTLIAETVTLDDGRSYRRVMNLSTPGPDRG